MILYQIIGGVSMFLRLLSVLIIIQCVLSFLVPSYSGVMRFLDRIVQPLLAPIRRLIFSLTHRSMMFDFSPFIALILLSLLQGLLSRLQFAALGIF